MASKRIIMREPFSALLHRIKADSQLTTADISHVCKVPVSTVNQWLQGLRVPNFRSAIALSEKLGVPLAVLAQCKEFHG